jgi:hypothetical protein
MGFLHWVDGNWFTLLQSLGIAGGLLFTAASHRLDAKARRTANLIEITKEHREIWTELYSRPELARISDASVDLEATPITSEEELFIGLLIFHLNSAYHAMRNGLYMKPDGLEKDVAQFFSRPIPRAIWERVRTFQDAELIRFVDACLASPEAKR